MLERSRKVNFVCCLFDAGVDPPKWKKIAQKDCEPFVPPLLFHWLLSTEPSPTADPAIEPDNRVDHLLCHVCRLRVSRLFDFDDVASARLNTCAMILFPLVFLHFLSFLHSILCCLRRYRRCALPENGCAQVGRWDHMMQYCSQQPQQLRLHCVSTITAISSPLWTSRVRKNNPQRQPSILTAPQGRLHIAEARTRHVRFNDTIEAQCLELWIWMLRGKCCRCCRCSRLACYRHSKRCLSLSERQRPLRLERLESRDRDK